MFLIILTIEIIKYFQQLQNKCEKSEKVELSSTKTANFLQRRTAYLVLSRGGFCTSKSQN